MVLNHGTMISVENIKKDLLSDLFQVILVPFYRQFSLDLRMGFPAHRIFWPQTQNVGP